MMLRKRELRRSRDKLLRVVQHSAINPSPCD
jgi:hypothetical protein